MEYKIFISGGFHHSSETYVNVSKEAYKAFDDVVNGKVSKAEWCERWLTKSQEKRLRNHFCGIKGCTCGSYTRAEWEKGTNKYDYIKVIQVYDSYGWEDVCTYDRDETCCKHDLKEYRASNTGSYRLINRRVKHE